MTNLPFLFANQPAFKNRTDNNRKHFSLVIFEVSAFSCPPQTER